MCYYPFFPGTDLPDDDYTTFVPHVKPTNTNNQTIPVTIDDRTKKKTLDEQKTIIQGISRHSTSSQNSQNHTQSAPPSPALQYTGKQRFRQKKASLDRVADEYSSNSLSLGTLEVRLKFDAKNNKMWIFVLKAKLETTQHLSKQTLVQVHLTVLPDKRTRYRTRVKPIENAMFAEEFFCKVTPEAIQNEGIRFRLYTYERFRRVKVLAEAIVMFAMVNLDEDMCKIIPLERAYPSQDSDLSVHNSHLRRDSSARPRGESTNSLVPELEIGLAYDKTQSMLTLEIGKGINLGMTSQSRAPDTYVQITLRDSTGAEMISNRTMTKYGQHHPIFAERYPFNIQENYLDQITVLISVMNQRSTNKTDRHIGCISFGREVSGSAQSSHWESILNSQGETITRWHSLLDVQSIP